MTTVKHKNWSKEQYEAIGWKTVATVLGKLPTLLPSMVLVQKGRCFSLHLNGVTTKMNGSQLQLIFHYCQIINTNVYDYGLNNTVKCMYPKAD